MRAALLFRGPPSHRSESVLFILTPYPIYATAGGGDTHGPRPWMAPPPVPVRPCLPDRFGQTVSAIERTERVASPAKMNSQTTSPMTRPAGTEAPPITSVEIFTAS